jgi:putative NADPH-quinone reductase
MRVLLVTGSTRSGSANTAALVTAAALAPPGVTAVLYQGLAGLPAFNPDHDGDLPPDPVAELRREIEGADAVLFCTPEYAGTLPGSLKNLLDWTVGGGQLYGKPVAWLTSPRRTEGLARSRPWRASSATWAPSSSNPPAATSRWTAQPSARTGRSPINGSRPAWRTPGRNSSVTPGTASASDRPTRPPAPPRHERPATRTANRPQH